MIAEMERLMKNVRVRAPGALDSAIQLEIFNTLHEFCKTSNIWREDIPFRVRTTSLTYSIEPTCRASVNRLIQVVNANDIPVRATMSMPGEVELGTLPTAAETFTATIALTVADPADSEGFPVIPSWILGKYSTELEDGVIGKLMSQPNKPYSNATLAVYHMRRFRGGISLAISEARRNNLYRAQSWAFPQNFA